jgi:hypothetical protein
MKMIWKREIEETKVKGELEEGREEKKEKNRKNRKYLAGIYDKLVQNN